MAFHRHQITGTRLGPKLLIIGGVHGDEYEPIAAIRRLIEEVTPEQLSGSLTCIPIVNEPAFLRVSRTGPDGLDLARTFPGREGGTITEEIAFAATRFIREADYLIDLHTGGLAARISPLTGYVLHQDQEIRRQQQQMAEAFNLPIVWGTTATLNGRSLSVARDANVPAIYAEWGGGGGCQSQGVDDYVQGCLNVMQMLGMRDSTSQASRLSYIVEDFREDSGVLQKNYPAEVPGYFEPAVELGDAVQLGDTLGWIHQMTAEPPVAVKSRQNGMVILLRAIPAVNTGDFLAVILEVNGPGEFHHE